MPKFPIGKKYLWHANTCSLMRDISFYGKTKVEFIELIFNKLEIILKITNYSWIYYHNTPK